MFCGKCGNQIQEGNNFCEYCGAAVAVAGNVEQKSIENSIKPTHATFESVWAAIQETDRIVRETSRSIQETDRTIKSLAEKQDEDNKRLKAERDEDNKRLKAERDEETKRLKAERDEDNKRLKAERDADHKQLKISLRNMTKEIGGIGKGNGGFAEEYFFNSLKNNMELFGEKFDTIAKNVPAGADDSNLDSEFDIVYYNSKSVAIVEVKYRAQFFHVLDTFDKANSFRNNYPKYANHRIYLALAAMFFDDEVEAECIHDGIAVIKQEGGNVVINDKNLKVF
jgi:hypothetical protein